MSKGRPSIDPNKRRTQHVGIRLRRDEMDLIYAIARQMRMDVAEYLRYCALRNVHAAKLQASREFSFHIKY